MAYYLQKHIIVIMTFLQTHGVNGILASKAQHCNNLYMITKHQHINDKYKYIVITTLSLYHCKCFYVKCFITCLMNNYEIDCSLFSALM